MLEDRSMPANRSLRLILAAAAALVVPLAMAACGASGSPSATEHPSSEPSTVPSDPASEEPVSTPAPSIEYLSDVDLVVGDCFDPVSHADNGSLLAAGMRSCDTPHLAEVFGTLALEAPAGEPYPGEAEADQQALEVCTDAFEAYVGIDFDHSKLAAGYVFPDAARWNAGDRFVLCFIESSQASPLTRSVKGSGL
jgi:hypothetical protein